MVDVFAVVVASLPPELWRKIINRAVPSAHFGQHPDLLSRRVQVLAKLCLVSWSFLELAGGLLYSHPFVKDGHAGACLCRTVDRRASGASLLSRALGKTKTVDFGVVGKPGRVFAEGKMVRPVLGRLVHHELVRVGCWGLSLDDKGWEACSGQSPLWS